jgi:23S rRNA (cytosine1962-C5)-methyltransferase
MNSSLNYNYLLLDSGGGEKLEQFGDTILIRPSKFAIWEKRKPQIWSRAASRYDHQNEWKGRLAADASFSFNFENLKLNLRLQRNGQVGLFPEHLTYLSELKDVIQTKPNAKVLNLFAYTGIASLYAASLKASVTHVELADQVISWAKENFEQNKISTVRIIKEDALRFIKRERARGSSYDVIIADPPSFSRITKKESWNLEDIFTGMLSDLFSLLSEDGAIFITSHAPEYNDLVMANLLRDLSGDKRTVKHRPLTLPEHDSSRGMPAGFLAIAGPPQP